ncbi:hypothetical protein VFPPC_16546 [Pochonia chlamydosporia 170]|uniref:Uncharacterized protein n=1 Tax=Pochonia chlamydosporia 170 TaxID=1380566 RepID=A0A179F8U9_METCM|nr:hypothetical protein VFPPC_16546 [Pochonia chlamydosporia 170]OAQ61701.1 hypothetical protein VFPPC_16546 [Pochonia chlamydosporia 170]
MTTTITLCVPITKTKTAVSPRFSTKRHSIINQLGLRRLVLATRSSCLHAVLSVTRPLDSSSPSAQSSPVQSAAAPENLGRNLVNPFALLSGTVKNRAPLNHR